jgi:hypothetical protein
VKRYELTHDDDPTRINSKPLAFLGYKDMSKVDTLAEFIAWGMKKFPAKHYIVSLSDHGAGFLGAEEDRGSMLSLPDLRAAFEKAEQMTGKKPDVIAFDCCLMQQAEVAYELKDRAKYLVASEEVIGGDGYPYKDVLPAIDQALTLGKTDPGEISKVIIEQAEKANEKSTFTLSAVNLKAIEDVVGAANELAEHILQGKANMEDVRAALKQTQHFSVSSPMKPYDDFRDIWDMADKLEQHPNITDPAIRKDLKELKKAVENAVIKNEHRKDEDYEGAHGMSIYAPRRQKNVSIPLMEEYGKTKFAQDASKWTEFIKEATDFDALVRKAKEEGTDKPKLTFIPLPQRM